MIGKMLADVDPLVPGGKESNSGNNNGNFMITNSFISRCLSVFYYLYTMLL